MRKQPKAFTVEVKRRPTSLAKKPAFVEPAAPTPAPPAAAAIFARAEAPAASATEAERRILPCLVTEAAIDAAKAVVDDSDDAPRKRGRPPKQRTADDLAPLAPRKRGRPRKTPAEVVEAVPPREQAPQAAPPKRPLALVAAAPVGASVRSGARRAAVSELPRGERWKRRLPKALR